MKNDKTTRLTSVRKPDGKLTETPEETLNELIKHHFKDNTNISDTHVNATLQERRSSTTAEHKINDDVFSPNRAKKAVEAFSPLTAAGRMESDRSRCKGAGSTFQTHLLQ